MAFKILSKEERLANRLERENEERIFQENKNKSCAFTGHRPDKLGGYDWNTPKNIEIGLALREQIIDLIENHNVSRFICGGALGIDQMAFAICNKLKEVRYSNIKLILAIPFKNQDCKWQTSDKTKWKKQIDCADEVYYIDELVQYKTNIVPIGDYHPAKMQKRNEWMVDNSKYIIAVWDGSKGGTGNCVKYVSKQIGDGRQVIIINPNNLQVDIRYY